ncbi:iron uptake protein [Coralloluteibacterium thermophilus]|uniref:Iron uptake protein n=1 Tax=Coralloluteibacterium thermophilum TaxID=2707049 RepID=A0ABV9NJV4_9GAMM
MSRAAAVPSPAPRLRLAARVGAAVLGGYAFAWGFIAAGAALLFKAGMDFHDAEFLASVLGLLAFLGVFLWTFATRRLLLAWLLLAGGGGLMAAVASLVQASIV